MRRIILLACFATAFVVVATGVARGAIRRTPTKPVTFPRVVREDFVTRLAAKVKPLVAIEPEIDYHPRCCFEATDDSTCRTDDANAMCWLDAGDGCGPAFDRAGEVAAYWPENAPIMMASSPRWGEVSREDQRRSIREILRVLAERQPARPVGLAAYAVGYVESGFNPTAEHPRTKACGLYQFLGGTWRDFAGPGAADDPSACRNPRENAAAAITFLSHLYDTHRETIVEQTPTWNEMTEWEQLQTIYVGLYSLHNYGENDPRWQDAENGARQIALAHIAVLKDFYDSLDGELKRTAPRPAASRSRAHRSPPAKRRR